MSENGRSSTAYEQLQRHAALAWYPISVSLIVFGLFSTFGLAAGQVQEALANYVIDRDAPWSSFAWDRTAITFAAIFAFAATMRYWTGRLVGVELRDLETVDALSGWQKLFMGVAWFAPWVGASLSFTDAALSLIGAQAGPDRSLFQEFAYLGGALARDPLETPFTPLAAGALVAPVLFLALRWSPLGLWLHRKTSGSDFLTGAQRATLPVLFVALASMFLVMPNFGIDVARLVGPVALLCVSAAVVTAAGSYLIHFGRTHGLPAFAVVAIAPLVLGAFGLDDNHYMRQLRGGPVQSDRPTAGEALERFQAELGGADEPIIIVSAEGSGIRAAHFTAAVLARLADHCPALARRIFAISGVSGGAVGAAAYRASLEAMPLQGEGCDLATDRAPGARERAFDEMFRRDHLSPILAKQMFPELVQTFLPASPRDGRAAFLGMTDRQLGLELSLEQAFADAFGVEPAESPFAASVFGNGGSIAAPHLLINMTEVASGGVFVASSLDLAPVRARHPWLHDFRCLWSPHAPDQGASECNTSPAFRLSTMAASSARFPVISPAGTVRLEQRTFRFVDGGYFDNSGAETLMGVIDHLQQEARANGRPLPPIAILHIDSNPYVLRLPVKWRLDFDIHELQAVLATREERVRISIDRLNNMRQDGRLCSLRFVEVSNNRVPLRLGWILSGPAAEELQAQAATQLGQAFPGASPPVCDGAVSRALHAATELEAEREAMAADEASR